MRYTDLLDEAELAQYARAFNARVRRSGRFEALTVDELRGVILESGGVCGWCGADLFDQPFEVDHIIPLAERGAHHPNNLVVACRKCNRQKAGMSPLRFALALAARTGRITPVIQRILTHYNADAPFQPRLFE
ncbi:HNH endonuclease signature motif containing protein [Aggregatilineales bacterium SYSU G02658]